MRYQGGKSRIASDIAALINSVSGGGETHLSVYFVEVVQLKAIYPDDRCQ